MFIDLSTMTEREVVPGFRVRLVHTENMTLAWWSVDAGACLPEHSHPHEQVAQVLEGSFRLTVAGETRTLGPGQVAVIPGNTVHTGEALTECRLLDVFYPLREDYR